MHGQCTGKMLLAEPWGCLEEFVFGQPGLPIKKNELGRTLTPLSMIHELIGPGTGCQDSYEQNETSPMKAVSRGGGTLGHSAPLFGIQEFFTSVQ